MSETKKNLLQWQEVQSIRMKGGNTLNIEALRSTFEKTLTEKYALNVTVEATTLGTGKIFDKTEIPCIVIKSADHVTDYNYIVISFEVQGIYGLFNFYMGGTSTNAFRMNEGNRHHETLTGAVIGAVRKAMVKDSQWHEEQAFYTAIYDAINEILA